MWIGGEVKSSDSNRTQTVEETHWRRGVWIGVLVGLWMELGLA